MRQVCVCAGGVSGSGRSAALLPAVRVLLALHGDGAAVCADGGGV